MHVRSLGTTPCKYRTIVIIGAFIVNIHFTTSTSTACDACKTTCMLLRPNDPPTVNNINMRSFIAKKSMSGYKSC